MFSLEEYTTTTLQLYEILRMIPLMNQPILIYLKLLGGTGEKYDKP